MIDWASVVTYKSGTFPDVLAINSTGAATQDGTEWIAGLINNGIFGPTQALMDYASLTPNSVTEAAGASQLITAFQKGFAVGPGKGVIWWLNDGPATTGDRVLLLEGQGVLITSYPDLVSACYVGDANNAAVGAAGGGFYKASDSGGATPDTAGPYFILPDARGYTLRGLDTAASVDPDGASRYLGDVQLDAFQAWQLGATEDTTGARDYWGTTQIRDQFQANTAGATFTPLHMRTTGQGNALMLKAMNDGTNGDPRTDSESRMTNISTRYGITY